MKNSDIRKLNYIITSSERLKEVLDKYDDDLKEFMKFREFYLAVFGAEVMVMTQLNELSNDFKDSNQNQEWDQIRGFRNLIAHDYPSTNAEQLWDIAHDDIPAITKWIKDEFGKDITELVDSEASNDIQELLNDDISKILGRDKRID